MSSILKVAASGMQAQQYVLDTIANNIANVDTTGYKKTRASFADAVRAVPPVNGAATGFITGSGVALSATQKVFSDGALSETDNPWDLAIVGNGFFQVLMPSGVTAYTRDGALSVDAEGHLVTAQGVLIEPPITIPDGAQNISIDEAGVIRGELNGQEGEFGSITLARFTNPEGLLAVGQNLFLATAASGQPQVGAAGSEGRGFLNAGVLENSNVDLAEEMTKTIEAQRAYQLGMKVLQTADEMLGLANNLRR